MGNNKNKTKPIYSVFAKKLNHLNQKNHDKMRFFKCYIYSKQAGIKT